MSRGGSARSLACHQSGILEIAVDGVDDGRLRGPGFQTREMPGFKAIISLKELKQAEKRLEERPSRRRKLLLDQSLACGQTLPADRGGRSCFTDQSMIIRKRARPESPDAGCPSIR
jgi:hypothetical protein